MLPMIPDGLAATVAAAAEDDQRAWDALVVRFTPMLRRVARSYRLSAQDADDVVQQCWIALLPHIGSIREPEAIGAWLVTTVRRRAVRAPALAARAALRPPVGGAGGGTRLPGDAGRRA